MTGAPGRRCGGCGAPLSRYNPQGTCSSCVARARSRQRDAPGAGPLDPAAPGHRIRELRRQRGWTLEVLASFAGLTKGTLSKLENGLVASPGAATLHALCAALAGLLGQPWAFPELPSGGCPSCMVREAYEAGRADAIGEMTAALRAVPRAPLAGHAGHAAHAGPITVNLLSPAETVQDR